VNELAKVEVLNLQEGDVVVLTTFEPLTPEKAQRIKRQWEEMHREAGLTVNHKLLVLERLEVKVLREGETVFSAPEL